MVEKNQIRRNEVENNEVENNEVENNEAKNEQVSQGAKNNAIKQALECNHEGWQRAE